MTVHSADHPADEVQTMGSANPKAKNVDEIDEDEAAGMWAISQGVIWVLGIAVLAWQDWWWPGVMVVVALSMIAGAITQTRVKKHVEAVRKEEEAARAAADAKSLHNTRSAALPERCNACGAPLSASSVLWRSDSTATCPYCDTAVKAHQVKAL